MADSIFGDIGKATGSVVESMGGDTGGLSEIGRMMGEINGQMGQILEATQAIHDAQQHVIDTLPMDAVHDATFDATHDAVYDVQPSHEVPDEPYVAHVDATHVDATHADTTHDADAYHADDATG